MLAPGKIALSLAASSSETQMTWCCRRRAAQRSSPNSNRLCSCHAVIWNSGAPCAVRTQAGAPAARAAMRAEYVFLLTVCVYDVGAPFAHERDHGAVDRPS